MYSVLIVMLIIIVVVQHVSAVAVSCSLNVKFLAVVVLRVVTV
jgi:hypothetical protein